MVTGQETTHPATRSARGSLGQLLAWRADERPDFPLLYVEDQGPWTVGVIAAQSAYLSRDLERVGVKAGDRVLVRLGNDERFLVALGAVSRGGDRQREVIDEQWHAGH
jgi:long-chain acyl-CoA synthetase